MRACRTITMRELPGDRRHFSVETSLGPAVMRRLTDRQVQKRPLAAGEFLWVDVATTPGAAVLLADGAAVATCVDLHALGADPRTAGVVRLHPQAELWLPCCGAGIDGCLVHNGHRASLALEHLLDAEELLPIPPISAGYPPPPTELRGEALHCLGLVMSGADGSQAWSLWADATGAPRGWERHAGVDALAAELRLPRRSLPVRHGHVRADGVEVDHRLPVAEALEELCRACAFGVRVLDPALRVG